MAKFSSVLMRQRPTSSQQDATKLARKIAVLETAIGGYTWTIEESGVAPEYVAQAERGRAQAQAKLAAAQADYAALFAAEN